MKRIKPVAEMSRLMALRGSWLAAPLLLALIAWPSFARAQEAQQEVVDRATLAVQDMFLGARPTDPIHLISRAKAVMICPQVFRAGFIVGGAGGSCVLVARNSAGGWTYPAFYGVASGSIGLQIGVQDAQIMMLILTGRGLSAVMDSQFKIGGDASASVATVGAGIEGATTAQLGADILVLGKSRGLFAGITLQGSVLTSHTESNQVFYGQPYAARQIVMQGQGRNQGAEPLREMLSRYGGGDAMTAAPAPYPAAPVAQPRQLAPMAPAAAPVAGPAPLAPAPIQLAPPPLH